MRPRPRPLRQALQAGPRTPILVCYTPFLSVFLPLLIFYLLSSFSALFFMAQQSRFGLGFMLGRMERNMQQSLPA